ncbi:Antitoxin component YwqK of the YwqJK toxin-antitoxin module [Paenibacillus sp. yr247]|uniref:stalk domain-containing protein n=1 Tax=Paenibacillus sp. yr247 TaxID=1761880 RepID=UPI00088D1171|nr:stalk domain-containing protein [Paenibacillus sp. yr247]SDO55298.1 Antitoxin component YwqK of the YwqJK toxin-antitoxin module [Paenibacillus sp. yr247]
MKKISAFLFFLTLLFCLSSQVFADDSVPVYLDGEQLIFDVPAMIDNGATIVPFRAIFEKLGIAVQWDPSTQTVKGTKDKLSVQMQIGSTSAQINTSTLKLSTAPKIIDGSTFIPLRVISEASGKIVYWDDKVRSVYIRTKPGDYIQSSLNDTNLTVTYDGETVNGIRQGLGKLIVNGKLLFEGDFKNNLIDGNGTLYYKGGQKYYVGEWSQGKMNGHGMLYRENGSVWYDATFVDSKITGQGKKVYENGDYYIGSLNDGSYEGEGKTYRANGTLNHEGQFHNNLYSGNGKAYYDNGKLQFEGTFKDGKAEGPGKLYYQSGKLKFEGEYHNGLLNGNAKVYAENGKLIYEGQWKGNKWDGQGTQYNSDGSVKFKGMFQNGKPVNQQN